MPNRAKCAYCNGTDPQSSVFLDQYYIECLRCGASGPYSYSLPDAEAEWNMMMDALKVLELLRSLDYTTDNRGNFECKADEIMPLINTAWEIEEDGD